MRAFGATWRRWRALYSQPVVTNAARSSLARRLRGASQMSHACAVTL